MKKRSPVTGAGSPGFPGWDAPTSGMTATTRLFPSAPAYAGYRLTDPTGQVRSIHLRAGELHDPGPLVGVGRDGCAVVLRRSRQRDTAQAGDALLDLRIGHREVHLLVEQGDDLRWRCFRRAQAVPGVGPI